MKATVLEKLKVLAESAKYDVSCASSGVTRRGRPGDVGSTAGWGICHSFTADGRCVSLLKIMLTNVCIYDCAYCINRRSNDIPRAAFTPGELAELTIEFYRRNYIEGLFLSSGVVRDPDYTMERMVRVARDLRTVHRFNGYIHLKSIPGASRELVAEAGRYADRMSVNIEIPTERNLQLLAPDKNYESIYRPMSYIQQGVLQSAEERTRFRHAPRFAPAGQSTQMIVGATDESDRDILLLSSALYGRPTMKRVYYSGFIPVNPYDKRLPALDKAPLVRENRLYQADWLMRFYGFRAEEIADEQTPRLDLDIDQAGLGFAESRVFSRRCQPCGLRGSAARAGHRGQVGPADRLLAPLPDADAAVAAADRRGDEEGAVFHQLPGTYCGAGRQRTAPRAGAPPADRSAAAENG